MQPVAASLVRPYVSRQPVGLTRAVSGTGRYALALVLLATYYYTIPVLKTPWGYSSYPTLDDLLSLLFIPASLSAITSRVRSVESRLFPFVLVAALLSMPSALIAYLGDPDFRVLRYSGWLSLHYIKMFAVFAAAAVLVIDERRFRRILLLVWVGSVFVGAYALLQYLGILSYRGWAEAFAESGPWSEGLDATQTVVGPLCFNHAALGNYMVVATMLAFALVRTSRSLMKLPALLSIPFFVAIAILSGSRAGLFGVLVGLVAYLALSKVRPAAIIGILCGCAVAYLVIQASPAFHERFVVSKGVSVAEFSSGRLEGWVQILAYMVRNPYTFLTGIGLGHMYYLAQIAQLPLTAAHNNYLHWLAEFGIFGLILALVVLVQLFRILHSMLGADRFRREIGVAFCSLLIALMGVATTQENLTPSLSLGRLGAYLALLFGLAVALHRTGLLQSAAARRTRGRTAPAGM
jgi:O-antigen ligase